MPDAHQYNASLSEGQENSHIITLPSAGKRKLAFTLAEVFSLHSAGSRKFAFTLAEVLITLGIIGVVAALTLPTLIQNYKEKQTISQLKKTYAVLSQAYLLAVEKHGEIKHWGLTLTSNGDIDEDGAYIILDNSGRERLLAYLAENLNVQKSDNTIFPKVNNLQGTLFSNRQIPPEQYVKLNDGTVISAGWSTKLGGDLIVFYNLPSCEKKGCTLGKDVFYFNVNSKGVIPDGADNKSSFDRFCNLKSTASDSGRKCVFWILQNENMDYLHCDNLSWDGKTKCK